MNQPPSSSKKIVGYGATRTLKESALIAAWVLGYAVILVIFRIAKTVESFVRAKVSGPPEREAEGIR